MLSLRDAASMERALLLPIDETLRSLLVQRVSHFELHELGQAIEFHVVQPGDTLDKIDAGLGFSVLQNLTDGTHFGDPDFTPCWEWMQDHGGWFELVYLFTDDGYGTIVFVQDHPGVEFDVHALCLEHARPGPPP